LLGLGAHNRSIEIFSPIRGKPAGSSPADLQSFLFGKVSGPRPRPFGGHGFLQKPYTAARLVEAVKQALAD